MLNVWHCADEDVPQDKMVCPDGCTPVFASPQMLRARQCQLECDRSDSLSGTSQTSCHSQKQQQDQSVHGKKGKIMQRLRSLWNTPVLHGSFAKEDRCEDNLVDVSVIKGPAADLWSLGIVLYEMVSNINSGVCSMVQPVVHCTVAFTKATVHYIAFVCCAVFFLLQCLLT